jgi:RNA polymerase sigma-70 factor (ECF subfamily)
LAKNETGPFLSDEELVHRYRNSHDTAYIGELYVRYTHLVYGVCLRYFRNDADAQDAVMQIFEKLIVELKKHHVEIFRPWLHTVVKNHCMMHFRKEASATKKETQLINNVKASMENAGDEHQDTEQEREQMSQYLSTGLDALKDEQRRCVELFYLKDMSYQQIVEETGYTMNEVKSYIQNGKRNLKIYITEQSNGKV